MGMQYSHVLSCDDGRDGYSVEGISVAASCRPYCLSRCDRTSRNLLCFDRAFFGYLRGF